ncbi:hypothetical protein EXIGLDRAFT_732441 [Exidia glandulosa HHB12029]|uniref:Uncharacterized protein n=1 Tax=Exidia glandulosa HHB12029 TaxID=1314781 RepID=A0A165BJ25_EXIGL|nr:hypothetical protein EXIGLDRAFT_732441 [Exidia glandulosa HHB12029]
MVALIDKLPNELLYAILVDTKQVESRDVPWSWRMAHVSKRWRHQIFSTQTLWERPLAFRHDSKLSRFRAESLLFDDQPLDMRLELLRCELHRARDAMSVVAEQFHRLSALYLKLAAAQIEGRCLDVLLKNIELPCLVTLSVSVTQKTNFSFGLRCPRLQDLSLDMMMPRKWDNLVSANLTQLSLANIRLESADFRHVLQCGCNIQAMALRNFGFLDAPDPFECALPRLHTLTISETHDFMLTMLYRILGARNVRDMTVLAKWGGANDYTRHLRVDDLPTVQSMTVDAWKLCIANHGTGVTRRYTYLGEEMFYHLARHRGLANTLRELDIALSSWVPLARALGSDCTLPGLDRLTTRVDHRGRVRGKELMQSTLAAADEQFIRCPQLRHVVLDGAPNTGWEQPDGPLIVHFVLALRSDNLASIKLQNLAFAPEEALAFEILNADFGVSVDYKVQQTRT